MAKGYTTPVHWDLPFVPKITPRFCGKSNDAKVTERDPPNLSITLFLVNHT